MNSLHRNVSVIQLRGCFLPIHSFYDIATIALIYDAREHDSQSYRTYTIKNACWSVSNHPQSVILTTIFMQMVMLLKGRLSDLQAEHHALFPHLIPFPNCAFGKAERQNLG